MEQTVTPTRIAAAPTRRRWRTVVAVAAGCVLLAACEAPRPDVTFYGNRNAVETPPTRWCEVDASAQSISCTDTPEAETARLSLRPGQPVQINVPGAVGENPWGVYFRYRNAAGELADGRTEIFTDGQLAYTLRPFTEDDQLVYVEVQTGYVLMGGEQSGVDFAVTRSWLLLVDPEQKSDAAVE
jgi:hypothetical protein